MGLVFGVDGDVMSLGGCVVLVVVGGGFGVLGYDDFGLVRGFVRLVLVSEVLGGEM